MSPTHFLVYQFMVSKFGGIQIETYDDFIEAAKSGNATRRFLPAKVWGMLNIDTQEILAEGYLCRYGFDLIKVKQGKIAEYYRRFLANKSYSFLAYDVNTMAVIESYKNIDSQLQKLDWGSGKLMQINNNTNYDSLPDDFKVAIDSFKYKRGVFMYAVKPYGGRILNFV